MDVAGGMGREGQYGVVGGVLGVLGREGEGKKGVVHEPVGWGEGSVGGGVDIEGVEGGVGGVGDGEAGCVERGGHHGDGWQAMLVTVERVDFEAQTTPTIIPLITKYQLAVEQCLIVKRSKNPPGKASEAVLSIVQSHSVQHVTEDLYTCLDSISERRGIVSEIRGSINQLY